MNCKQSTQLISAGQDRRLHLREKLALLIHLITCLGCRNYRRQLHFLPQACRRLPFSGDR